MAAERVRTLVEARVSAALGIPGIEVDEPGSGAPEARAVNTDGDVILLVPADTDAARAAAQAPDDGLRAVMEITDVAPVSVPHRIRGRSWVTGRLSTVPRDRQQEAADLLVARDPACPSVHGARWALLRLRVREAYVDDLWGAEHVDAADFAAAAPDPLRHHEAGLLQHLASAHPDRLGQLYSLLGQDATPPTAEQSVAPLALDRYGMRLRYWGAHGGFDVRFEFPEPVTDVTGLRREMHRLFTAG